MKTTAQYLDELVAKTGAKSDGACGLLLGWTRSATSNYRRCQTAFDNHTCLIVARTLAIPLEQVIADMELQREKDEKKKADWLGFESRLRGAAASIIGASLVTLGVCALPQNAHASTAYATSILPATNYTNYRRRFRTGAAAARNALNMLFRRVCWSYPLNSGITA